MEQFITDAQWEQYQRDGYVKLGKILSDDEVITLQRRLIDIMLGEAEVDYDRMVMQRDREPGVYEDVGLQTLGFKGPSLNYRVVYGLEHDSLFLEYMQRPLFREVCDRVYGPETDIAAYRAFVMNKPANGGTYLNWHQDRWTFLSPDPLVTVWTALDAATIANGCVQVIPGSHRYLINPENESGFITPEQTAEHCSDDKRVYIELEPGEVALLHNWLLHSSDKNETDLPRKGFSVCYIDAATRDIRPLEERAKYDQQEYPVIFGANALVPAGSSS